MQLSVSKPSPTTPTVGAHASTVALASGPLASGSASIGKAEATFAQLLPTVTPVAAKAPKGDGTPTAAQLEAAAAVLAGWSPLPSPPPPPAVSLPKAAPAVGAPAQATTTLTDESAAAALAARTPAAPVPAAPRAPAAPTAYETTVASLQSKAAAQPTAPAAPPTPTPPAAPAPAPAPASLTASAATAAAAEAQGAKIAVPVTKDSSSGSAISKAVSKKIQNSDNKEVTSTAPTLGTAVAKVPIVMPATATTERHASVPSIPEVASVGSSSSGPSLTPSSAPTETASTAQSAVQAAMTAAELVSSTAQGKAVNLQFSMGNADLKLRVELVNGQVHATFATDSAQLRSDLAHEWQASSSSAGHSGLNLAPPTFTAATAGNSLGSGDRAPQQRGRDQAPADAATPYGSASSSVSPAAADDGATPRVPVSLASSQHLQTFA